MGVETENRVPAGTKRSVWIDSLVAMAMLVLSFVGIAATEMSAQWAQVYWAATVIAFWVGTLVLDRGYFRGGKEFARSATLAALHWGAVLLAIQLVYFLISAGQIEDPDAGLVNGIILALGAFATGVHQNWRLMVIGVALGAAVAGLGLVDEYLWVLLGLAAVVLVALLIGARFLAKPRAQVAAA